MRIGKGSGAKTRVKEDRDQLLLFIEFLFQLSTVIVANFCKKLSNRNARTNFLTTNIT